MTRPHTFIPHKPLARQICSHCGLVWLRNLVSDIAAHQPCRWWS